MAQVVSTVGMRRVKYDLSDVKVGESIFSTNKEMATLCIRTSDENWEVYEYDTACQKIQQHTINDPNYNISFYNEIFDVEKTKWVKEYFDKVVLCTQILSNFNYKIKHKFNW